MGGHDGGSGKGRVGKDEEVMKVFNRQRKNQDPSYQKNVVK